MPPKVLLSNLTPLLAFFSATSHASSSSSSLLLEGSGFLGVAYTPNASAIAGAAGRLPLASSSVSFTHPYNNTLEPWTWHINISEVLVPNNASTLGQPNANRSLNLHVANLQWGIDWPGGNDNKTLNAFLGERNLSIVFNAVVMRDPPNLSKYKDRDNGSCVNVLGQDCTKSLVDQASYSKDMVFEKCGSVFSGKTEWDELGMAFAPRNSTSNMSDTDLFHCGDTLFFQTSQTEPMNHHENAYEDKKALQVFTMAYRNTDGSAFGQVGDATVLCRVVDKSAKSAANRLGVSVIGAGVVVIVFWSMFLL